MTEPYETPQSSPDFSEITERLRLRRSFWFRAIWVSLAGVVAPPMIGLAATVFGMVKAFGDLSGSGVGDPAALSNHISEVLVFTAAGLVGSVIAFFVLIVALIRFFTLPTVSGEPSQESMHNKS